MESRETALDGLIMDDTKAGVFRVNRRSFVDPRVFEAENRLIFDHCWLYVGHESELREANFFIRRKVGGRWMIFVRDDEGAVRVLFDTCVHRGNSVCRGNSG